MSDETYLAEMGTRIWALRKKKKLRQDQLGFARSQISSIESGDRNCCILTLKRIAEKLGCQVVDLLPY